MNLYTKLIMRFLKTYCPQHYYKYMNFFKYRKETTPSMLFLFVSDNEVVDFKESFFINELWRFNFLTPYLLWLLQKELGHIEIKSKEIENAVKDYKLNSFLRDRLGEKRFLSIRRNYLTIDIQS